MLLKNRFRVLRTQGLKAFLVNKYRRQRYKVLSLLCYTKEDSQEWLKLKGKYRGNRVFLIGNGPSLNKTPLYLLKNEYTMCFNHFGIMLERLNWNPNFYMSTDYLVLVDISKDIDSVLNQCEYAFFPKIHYEGKRIYNLIKKTSKIFWLKPMKGMGFSMNMPDTYGGGTVVYSGLQVLNYLGFDEIILLGIDMNYQIHTNVSKLNSYSEEIKSNDNDDPNHFDPRYFGKGKSYHQPKQFIVDNILSAFNYIGRNQAKFKTNIINAVYDSKVNSFPHVEFDKLFNFEEEDKRAIFEELLSKHSMYKTVNDFERNTTELTCYNDLDDYNDDFYSSIKIALHIYKKIIFTHIPLGPYNGKYYFVKRK